MRVAGRPARDAARRAPVAARRAPSRARSLYRANSKALAAHARRRRRSCAITAPTHAIAEAYAASDAGAAAVAQARSLRPHRARSARAGRPVLGWAHGGVGELLREWQPRGAVPPFDADALLHGAHGAAGGAAAASGYDARRPARDAAGHARPLRATCMSSLDHRIADARDASERAPSAGAGRRRGCWRSSRCGPRPAMPKACMVLGALVADRPTAAGALPRRHGAAQRAGVGADQCAVLRVLAAGSCSPRSMRSTARMRWHEALVDLRYLPFLWLVAAAVADNRGRRVTFSGLAIIVGVWTLDALAAGADRHQSAVLEHRQHQAADQRPRDVPRRRSGARRSAQRRPRALQPQARAGAGQPVAVRAACGGQALRARRLVRGRRGIGHGDPARRRARLVADVRAGAAGVGLARAGCRSACSACSPSARWRLAC